MNAKRGIYEEENAHYIGNFGKAPENYALYQLYIMASH